MDHLCTTTESIREVINKLKSSNDLPIEELGREATKLAILNASLGEYVPQLELELHNLDGAKKQAELLEYKKQRDAGASVKDAEMGAKLETVELSDELNQKEYEFKSVKNLHDNSWKVVSAIQSRIKSLGGERSSSNLSD